MDHLQRCLDYMYAGNRDRYVLARTLAEMDHLKGECVAAPVVTNAGLFFGHILRMGDIYCHLSPMSNLTELMEEQTHDITTPCTIGRDNIVTYYPKEDTEGPGLTEEQAGWRDWAVRAIGGTWFPGSRRGAEIEIDRLGVNPADCQSREEYALRLMEKIGYNINWSEQKT